MLVCLRAGRQVGVWAGLQASVCMSIRIVIHANPHSGRLAGIHVDISTLVTLSSLILVLLLGSIGIGKRCFVVQNNSTNSNPFAGGLSDCCFHEKAARCPSSYSKAFRLLPKSGSSKVCFELLKTFRVTPESLAAGLPLRSRAACSNLRYSWVIPCTLYRTILFCYTMWCARCRVVLQLIFGYPLPVPRHGVSSSFQCRLKKTKRQPPKAFHQIPMYLP